MDNSLKPRHSTKDLFSTSTVEIPEGAYKATLNFLLAFLDSTMLMCDKHNIDAATEVVRMKVGNEMPLYALMHGAAELLDETKRYGYTPSFSLQSRTYSETERLAILKNFNT